MEKLKAFLHNEPYLFFEGRCEEALAFYEKAIGAKVQMKMRYSESPEGSGGCPLAEDGKVMQPLTKTFFSPAFGMVADKFGVNWMVLVYKAM